MIMDYCLCRALPVAGTITAEIIDLPVSKRYRYDLEKNATQMAAIRCVCG